MCQAAFHLDAGLIGSNDVYAYTRQIINEYRFDGTSVFFFSQTIAPPDSSIHTALGLTDQNVISSVSDIGAFCRNRKIKTLYSADASLSAKARAAGVHTVRIHDGTGTFTAAELAALRTMDGEPILLQYEIREKISIPLRGETAATNDGIMNSGVRYRPAGIIISRKRGDSAIRFMNTRIRNASAILLSPCSLDADGAAVRAHLFIDGEALSVLLVRYGHARECISREGDSGFPVIARDIMRLSSGVAVD